MSQLRDTASSLPPGLLASVADLREMELARAGGADIIDLKQPAFGALGAWSPEALTAAVMLWNAWGEQLGEAARPALSATAGDQPMVPALIRAAAERVAETGVPIVKVGLFHSKHTNECIEALAPLASRARLIGVLFADQEPDFAVVGALGRAGFAGVMIDTADKRAGSLTEHLDPLTLGQFVAEARRHGLITGLAGSLRLGDIPSLTGVGADYLGFRGALCEGGRTGALDPMRLGQVYARLREPTDHSRP
ncbi:(5-formylfuran-3-yl)methyl phosphate synthase [Starkeya koreensis]|uniref:(5-formylfuran-3-yl)methyl phosphate synthase n=1 Tax=Ancylobacter koreensis TaxID=266121 RepID=A0ABT0DNX0_9HYPH|nr:(5-formylfuran-3-yl)methyl phosphate synthase [Ancylobacter koreensis]MCK0208968.1 (5-formylfuran-3-yl)methyl phosphate synthase [Ancylobacter koreensis]